MKNVKDAFHVIVNNGENVTDLYFINLSAFEDWLEDNYNEECEYLVQCAFGGWIDIRDCY